MTSPRGPNEKITAMAVVNGGEMSGRTVATSSTRDHARGRLARTAANANTKPSTVPATPTSPASSRLLAKARRWWASPKMAVTCSRVGRPSPPTKAFSSSVPSG